MLKIARFLPLYVLAAWLVFAQSAAADGWSLWPTSNTDSKTPTKTVSSTKKSSSSSKSVWDYLQPWKKSKPAPKATSVNPYRSSMRSTAKDSSDNKSWFGSLFQKEEPQKPRTVSEWMDQSRVGS